MRTPSVRLQLPGGRQATVAPGGIIGRLKTAACRLEDPAVSEAHALVSLRGRELRLLKLRGALTIDGHPEDDVALAPGQRIVLTDESALTVLEVHLPLEVLALRLPDQPPRELCAPSYWLTLSPTPDLIPAYVEGAAARVWSTAEDWRIQLDGEPSRRVRVGQRWAIEGVTIEACLMPLSDAGATRTVGALTLPHPPLTILDRYTSVHLLRRDRLPVVLSGKPARIVSELASTGVPTAWETAAREIWGRESDELRLRGVWDRAMSRLRTRLREHGVRDDLVRADGHGNFELFLLPGDTVRDDG
jgi:hypothetical protein